MKNSSLTNIFERLLSVENNTYDCEQTIIYARQKLSHNHPTGNEKKTFLANLFYSGYNILSSERFNWLLDED